MRLIDGEFLERHLESLYEIKGWDKSEKHFSLNDMRANIRTEPEIHAIYGFEIDELVLLADTIRKAGRTPEEVTLLIEDTKTLVQTVLQIVNDEQEKAIREATKGYG